MFSKETRAAIFVGVLTAVSGSLLACSVDGGADEDADGRSTLRYMSYPGATNLVPIFVGLDSGAYDRAGIKLEVVDQPSGLEASQALRASNSDITSMTMGTLATAHQAGVEVKLFCGMQPQTPVALVAPPDAGIPVADETSWEESLSALSGKTIGIMVPEGSGFQTLFDAALAEAGVTEQTYVTVGADPKVIGAALGNSVDVAMASVPGIQHLVAAGTAQEVLFLPDGPPEYADYYGAGSAALTDFLDEDPELASAFCDATQEAIEYMNDPTNADEVVQIMVDRMGLTREVAELALPSFSSNTTEIDPAVIETTIDAYAELGIISGDAPTVDELVMKVN